MPVATALLCGDGAHAGRTACFAPRRHTRDKRTWIRLGLFPNLSPSKQYSVGLWPQMPPHLLMLHNTPPRKQTVFVPCCWPSVKLLILVGRSYHLNQNISFMYTCWSHWWCCQTAWWGPQLCILTWPTHSKRLKLTCGPGLPLWCRHLGRGWEHFPACCDRFFQPRPPQALSCTQTLHIEIVFADIF